MSQQRFIIPRDYPTPVGKGHDSNATKWEKTQDNFDELYSLRYDDLRFPAQGINPAGTAAPPTVITSTSGYTGCLSFAGNAENVIAGVAQMPHAWVGGRADSPDPLIRPHIHWCRAAQSGSPVGTVGWKFYYRILGNPGDLPGEWSAGDDPTGTIGGDDGSEDIHYLTLFPSIDMTGYIESAMLVWRLHRMGNTDSESGAAILFELDFHFAIDKNGTTSVVPSE